MANGLNLTSKETAERLRVTVGHLAKWRMTGDGPRYIQWGRRVLYPVTELEAFEGKHLKTSVHSKEAK